jgi:4-hydroxy-2-oxoheptanedioate aldolase
VRVLLTRRGTRTRANGPTYTDVGRPFQGLLVRGPERPALRQTVRRAWQLTTLLAALNVLIPGHAEAPRLNTVIELLERGQPVFGVYAPSAFPQGGRRGAAPSDTPPRSATDLAVDALGYLHADFLFNGSMENGVDRGLPTFTLFVKALTERASLIKTQPPHAHVVPPLIVKTSKIAVDPPDKVAANISRQLNVGTSGIMFVEAESAEEVRLGLNAMRFKSNGGRRPDDVGMAPGVWGMSEEEYRRKADLWPLNGEGELINWTIVESKEGLAHVREIAAVKGIGVLWPGAGTLRQVFSTTNAAGERILDQPGWENAIQTVLAACKEFKVPCGYPANANDIEMRMKQGFSVFVMNWGEAGFKGVEIGRKIAGR